MGSLRSLARQRYFEKWMEIRLETGWTAGARWCCYDFTTVPDRDVDIARQQMIRKNCESAMLYSDISEIPDEFNTGYYFRWCQDRWGLHGSVRNRKDPEWRHWE